MVRPLRVRDLRYAVHPFNLVFGSPSHVAILRALKDLAMGATGREIARRSGVTRLAVMNALAVLESAGIVRRQVAGRAHVFRLNRDHVLVRKGLVPLFEAEEGFQAGARARLAKAVSKGSLAGVVFGSAARGEETSESDLDVCVLVDREADKESTRRRLGQVAESREREWGLRLARLVFPRAEFRRGYRQKKPFFANVVREGKSFHGPDLKEIVRDPAN